MAVVRRSKVFFFLWEVLPFKQGFGTKLTLKSKKKVGKSLSRENQGKDAGCMAVSPFSPG